MTKIAQLAPGAVVISIPGIVPGKLLWQLYQKTGVGLSTKTMVFSDPTKLLLSAGYEKIGVLLERFVANGGRVVVKKRIPLLALVINPFYPLLTAKSFRQAFLDGDVLKQAIAEVTRVPIINVKDTKQNYYLDTNGKEVRVVS